MEVTWMDRNGKPIRHACYKLKISGGMHSVTRVWPFRWHPYVNKNVITFRTIKNINSPLAVDVQSLWHIKFRLGRLLAKGELYSRFRESNILGILNIFGRWKSLWSSYPLEIENDQHTYRSMSLTSCLYINILLLQDMYVNSESFSNQDNKLSHPNSKAIFIGVCPWRKQWISFSRVNWKYETCMKVFGEPHFGCRENKRGDIQGPSLNPAHSNRMMWLLLSLCKISAGCPLNIALGKDWYHCRKIL